MTLVAALFQVACVGTDRDLEAAADRSGIEERFGVEVVSTDISARVEALLTPVRANNPSPPALRLYLAWLSDQLRPYPDGAFECARIERVILVSQLQVPVARSRGNRNHAARGDRRSAVPAIVDGALILDVDASADPLYKKRILHHEYFHMLDAALLTDPRSDAEWNALNAEDFAYGSGGANTSRFVDYLAPYTNRPGFVTAYAATSVIEDKAEVFSLRYVMPNVLRERIASDPIIAEKFALMERRLTTRCPGFVFPDA